MAEETFTLRDPQKPLLDFNDMPTPTRTKITLRVHRSVMDRVLDHCGYDDVSPDGEDRYIVRFPFVENEYYYDVLLSFGEACECLEPSRVRAKMQQKLRDMLALYAK